MISQLNIIMSHKEPNKDINTNMLFMMNVMASCYGKKDDDFEQCCIDCTNDIINKAKALKNSIDKLKKEDINIVDMLNTFQK